MTDILIKIMIACFGSVIFCLLYLVFFSYSKYNVVANYVPSPIFPLFIIVVFIFGFIFAKKLLVDNWSLDILFYVFLIILFIVLSNFIYNKYGYILEHYYQNTPNTNLIGFKDYKNQKGNYPVIKKELEKQGIRVKHINVGYTDKFDWETTEEYHSYTKAIYSINNNNFYIIFDWTSGEVVMNIKSNELEQYFLKNVGMENGMSLELNVGVVTVRNMDTESNINRIYKNYKIVPGENNSFEFIEV